MPRYFFHVIDGKKLIDKQGSELSDLRQARVEAIQLAGAIIKDEGDEFWNGEEWHMNVTDAPGQSVLKLRFSADDQCIAPEVDRRAETQSESRATRELRDRLDGCRLGRFEGEPPVLKRYHVDLTRQERADLLGLLNKGIAPARTLTRARVLLAADEHKTDLEIAASLHVHPATVERTWRRFDEGRAACALHEKPRPGGRAKLDPKQEAFLVALACSHAPTGRGHWTMQLLADRLVELGVVETISDATVRRALRKTP